MACYDELVQNPSARRVLDIILLFTTLDEALGENAR